MEKNQSEELWDLLRSIQNKMREHVYQTYKKHDISVQEALLIRELFYHADISLNELSARLGLSKSTVSSMISRMETQGIVIREVPNHNRRSVQLRLSPEYSSRPEIIALKDELLHGLMHNLSHSEQNQIVEGLRKLNENMQINTL